MRFFLSPLSTSFCRWPALLLVLLALGITPQARATVFTAGEATDLGGSAIIGDNYLLFFPMTISTNGQLQKLGIIIKSGSGYQGVLGVYAADGAGGGPGTKLGSTAPFTISATGRLEVAVTNPPVLAVGNYWIAASYSANSSQGYTTTAASTTTTCYKAQTFNGTLPGTVSGLSSYTGQRWNHYAILDDNLTAGMAVQQPAGTTLLHGNLRSFGAFTGTSASLTFTITNFGIVSLVISNINFNGVNAGEFVATAPGTNTIAPHASTTFSVQLTPAAGGNRVAVMQIISNDDTTNSFGINLSGQRLFSTQDTDGDGLNDAAEFQWSALGFDWQVPQPALVSDFFTDANNAGLYTASQVQALNLDTPLLARNPTNGSFTLTIGLQKATSLTNFIAFPMSASEVSIDPLGKLNFNFTSPDDAAFFRLQAE